MELDRMLVMGVRRFKNPDDARQALWTDKGDPALPRRIRSLWARAARLAKPTPSKGVKRFRDIEDANAERDRETAARTKRLRAERARP
jgi:hypothetical protein